MSHKILVIDDEPDLLHLVEARLKTGGFEVFTALGPQEGLIRIREKSPDLIILDVLMPQMTGYQLVREIKNLPEPFRKIPIIVTSSRQDMKDFFSSWEIFGFIRKPFEGAALLEQVRAALKIKASGAGEPGPAASSPSAAAVPSVPSSSRGLVLISGIDDYLMGKLKDFMTQQGYSVELSGQEEDTIEQALKLKPRLVLGQYVESAMTFDLRRIQKKLKADPATQTVRFTAFCSSQLGVDAVKNLEKADVLLYQKTDELLAKLGDHLKQKPL